ESRGVIHMLVKSHCTTSAEMRWMWRLVPIQVSIHGASSTTCRSLSIAKYNGHTTIPATPAEIRYATHAITSSASGAACSHRVLCRLHRTSPDNLSGRLSFKHGWLFRERIDASPLFRGRLFDDHKFCKARQQECSILLQFL